MHIVQTPGVGRFQAGLGYGRLWVERVPAVPGDFIERHGDVVTGAQLAAVVEFSRCPGAARVFPFGLVREREPVAERARERLVQTVAEFLRLFRRNVVHGEVRADPERFSARARRLGELFLRGPHDRLPLRLRHLEFPHGKLVLLEFVNHAPVLVDRLVRRWLAVHLHRDGSGGQRDELERDLAGEHEPDGGQGAVLVFVDGRDRGHAGCVQESRGAEEAGEQDGTEAGRSGRFHHEEENPFGGAEKRSTSETRQ